eukprot:CAMPEP_0169227788 /NCGR_PEP_ID=MMETSP1016-20121227/24490_1 /TAXON_ID=342587 /ORGANISM="Karlodinium micrum, Strain CCMP2283" /LENGTH=52 /DNA_ID=CAMNT_0009306529 /DNA_START=106 /DNA_END=267 /DNA_ORIENTATION=-
MYGEYHARRCRISFWSDTKEGNGADFEGSLSSRASMGMNGDDERCIGMRIRM